MESCEWEGPGCDAPLQKGESPSLWASGEKSGEQSYVIGSGPGGEVAYWRDHDSKG